MKKIRKFLYFVIIAAFVTTVNFSASFAGEEQKAEPAFKAVTGKVLFYSEPHDKGKVKVGDQKIVFNSLAFKDRKIVALGDTVSFKTNGKKVAKGSMVKQ